MVSKTFTRDLTHVLIFVVLIFVLWFVASWIFGCGKIPLIGPAIKPWSCGAYYAILGKPRVLIVYGDDGLGNPDLLQEALANPEVLGVHSTTIHLNRVSIGNLKQFQLVIVEKAKKIETDKLKMFMDYVSQGGKLVWTGDAGTELGAEDELLYEDENPNIKGSHVPIGPWARKKGDNIVAFDEFLGVNYKGNFCDFKPCSEGKSNYAGNLKPEPLAEHPLVYGLASAGLQLHVFKGEDFAIVKTYSYIPSNEALSIDFGSNIVIKEDTKEENLGSTLPLIVAAGFGERVAYYALPPEYFVNPKLEDKYKYTTLLENMYIGMITG